jgi:hypothetical protein
MDPALPERMEKLLSEYVRINNLILETDYYKSK